MLTIRLVKQYFRKIQKKKKEKNIQAMATYIAYIECQKTRSATHPGKTPHDEQRHRGKMTDLAEQRTEGKWKRMEIGVDGIALSVDAVLTCESRS